MLFDRKHELDEARVRRRRDRMAGMWAAELLGLIGKAAHDYAHEVAHPAEPGPAAGEDDRVAHRLARDLHGKVTIHEIRDKLAHLVHEAKRQLLHEQDRPPGTKEDPGRSDAGGPDQEGKGGG